MDAQTTQRLIRLNNEFYRANAQSFSATRQYAWEGWEKLASALPRRPLRVVDIACGNMRFKRFLESAYGIGSFEYLGIDSCDELVPDTLRGEYAHVDILSDPGNAWTAGLEGRFDLAACFGFMHHVPGADNRLRLIDGLLDLLTPQGYACISFWQFGKNAKLLEKAIATTAKGAHELDLSLEDGDYLLGWKDERESYRYCHSFSDAEIDAIAAHASQSAKLIGRYSADGKTGDLNAYLVLEKTS